KWSGRVSLESADRKTPRRTQPVLFENGKATIDQVKPGVYDVVLVSGTMVSTTARVEVHEDAGAEATLHMEAAGGLRIAVHDSLGRTVDPVFADVYQVADGDA